MSDNIIDPFALEGTQPDPIDALTAAERRFIEGWRRLFPDYRFEDSRYAKAKAKAADAEKGGAT
jgi:hypothetical protein